MCILLHPMGVLRREKESMLDHSSTAVVVARRGKTISYTVFRLGTSERCHVTGMQINCKLALAEESGTFTCCLVTVVVTLERTIGAHADVVGLLLREHSQLGSQCREVQLRDLLVQLLRQQVDIVLVGLGLLPILQDVQLCQHLVCEGARHHKRRMPGSTAQVQEPTACQNDHTMPIWEDEAVHLRLDVLDLDAWEALDACHVDLVIEVAN